MPKFRIEASAQFNGIGSMTMPEDYPWHVHLLCGNCGEKPQKPIVLMASEIVEGVRGASVHLRMTCKLCARTNDVKIISDQMTYSESDAPKWMPILILECRGIEPTGITLADDTPLKIMGEEGYNFEDVFIEDGEYYGWDEKRGVEASITEFQIRVAKE